MAFLMPAAAGAKTTMKPVSSTASTPMAMTVSSRVKPRLVAGSGVFMNQNGLLEVKLWMPIWSGLR